MAAKFYCDTNVFIQLGERSDIELQRFVERVANSESRVVTSEMTLAEILVKPKQQERGDLVEFYEDLLVTRPLLEVVPVSRPILRRSADLRASDVSTKLPDAIHVATAIETGCHWVLSSDKRLRVPSPLRQVGIEQLQEIDVR